MFYNAAALSTLNLSNWGSNRTAATVEMKSMFASTSGMITLNMTNFKTDNVTDMSSMFQSTGLTELNLSDWSVDKVRTFSQMFASSVLTNLNLSNWGKERSVVNVSMDNMFQNTAQLNTLVLTEFKVDNVTSMINMFAGTGLTELNLNDWNVSEVQYFSQMFMGASHLVTLNLCNWGLNRTATNVYMSNMISGTSALQTLLLNGFTTNNVIDLSSMFAQTGLSSLDLSSWDVSQVKSYASMFYGSKLTSLSLAGWGNTGSPETVNMTSMFQNTTNLSSLNITNFKTNNVTNMSSMFRNTCLTALNLSDWDVAKVETFASMFLDSTTLNTLNLSNWGVDRTASTVNMMYMFGNTSGLTTSGLTLTNFETTNVTNMSYMFYKTGLSELDLSNWNVTKVMYFNYMFYTANKLTSLNLSGWGADRTATTVNMTYMFGSTGALTTLNLNNFLTTNVTNMNSMFILSGITDLDLSNWDVTKVTDFGSMFSNSKIRILNLSGWNTLSTAYNCADMFTWTADLWKITLSENIKFTGISTFVTAPPIGATITDNGQNYKITSASWQAVGNGTDHHPTGDMVTTTQMYADRSEPVTYVWAQAPTFDGVANLTFGTLGAGDFRNGNKPLATNMATGSVNLINLESSVPYKVSVGQTSDWTTSGQSATISKNALSIQYGDNSLTDSVDFWSGNSTTSQKSILFNHNATNAFSIWLNPNAVIDTILLGKQLQSELTWTLSETP